MNRDFHYVFVFRELWKDRFIFRETWSRPPPLPPSFNALMYCRSEAYEETDRKIQDIHIHDVSLRVVFFAVI